MAVSDYTPTPTEVARLIPSRAAGRFTGGGMSNDPPEFPDESRVQDVIDQAASTIAVRLGGDLLAEKFYGAAKALIVLRVALMLEPSAWPEQARPDKSAWEQWKLLYDDDMPALVAVIKADAEDGDDGDGGPEQIAGAVFSFPAFDAFDPQFPFSGRVI